MKMIKVVAVLGAVLAMSGCMNSKFSCPGMPSGVVCKKPSEVYAMTNNGRLATNNGAEEACDKKCQKKRQAQGGEASGLLQNRLLEPLTGPMPIREAPQVMRVWVAPYNDENDDLHWPSFVFTEITKRRWSIGETAAGETVTLTPMQVVSSAAPTEDQAAANAMNAASAAGVGGMQPKAEQ